MPKSKMTNLVIFDFGWIERNEKGKSGICPAFDQGSKA